MYNDNFMIATRAPTRISFSSCGDTDYYIDLIGTGNAFSGTIDLYAHSEIVRMVDSGIVLQAGNSPALHLDSTDQISFDGSNKEDELNLMKAVAKHYGNTRIAVRTYSKVPVGSGLGGSASHAVSLIRAFEELNDSKKTNEDVAKLAYHLERKVLEVKGGYQDQYAAAFRGINYMEFRKDDVTVTPLSISEGLLQELERELLLVYIPRQVAGTEIHTQQKAKSQESVELLLEKRENVKAIRSVFERRDFREFGELMHKDWEIKKQLAGGISNPRVDQVYDAALKSGALGGRFIGAGGGGCAIFYTDGKRQNVLNVLQELGVAELPYKFERV